MVVIMNTLEEGHPLGTVCLIDFAFGFCLWCMRACPHPCYVVRSVRNLVQGTHLKPHVLLVKLFWDQLMCAGPILGVQSHSINMFLADVEHDREHMDEKVSLSSLWAFPGDIKMCLFLQPSVQFLCFV